MILVLCAAIIFSILRVGYEAGPVTAPTYNFLSSLLLVASVVIGVVAAGILGYLGFTALVGVLVCISPVLGLSIASLLTAALDLGRYDSSPVVLLGGLLLSTALLGGTAWFVGRAVS